jgi:hypothetical protein
MLSQNRRIRCFILLFSLCCFPRLASSQFSPGLPGSFNACDFCLASQGISPLEVGSSGMRIDVRYLSVGTLYRDGSRATNSDQELESHLTQQYTLFFALDNSFSLSAVVPVPRRHSEQVTSQGEMITGNQFGLGDVSLLVRFKPLVTHDVEATYILSLVGGVKLPTGKTDGHDSQGGLLDAHVQLGTASTDILAGGSGFATTERFTFIVNLLGSYTGKGANGHQFGNSLNYDATVRYRTWPEEYDFPQVFLTLSLIGELRGRETQDRTIDPNSGGNVLYASPGLQVFITPGLTFELSYQQPFVHTLNGQQLGEDFRLISGMQILF